MPNEDTTHFKAGDGRWKAMGDSFSRKSMAAKQGHFIRIDMKLEDK